MSVAVCVRVDEAALDVVVGDDAGAVAELVPPLGVVLVVVLLVLVAVDVAGLDEAGALVDVLAGDVLEVDVLGDVFVAEDVPVVGGVVALVAGVVVGGGVVVGACIGSHCETVGVELTVPVTVLPGELELSARGALTAATEARLCGASAVLTTSAPVVDSKIPPAMRPIDTGRTRAKHM